MSDDSFMKKLKGFTPESSGLDRDLLMFAAGQGSARAERSGDRGKTPNASRFAPKATSGQCGEQLPPVAAAAAMAEARKPSSNGQFCETDAITLVRDVKSLAGKAGGYERLMELVKATGRMMKGASYVRKKRMLSNPA